MLAKHIACGAGLGLIKPAPGTWGSLGALICAFGVCYVAPAAIIQWVFVALAGLSLIAGLLATPKAQQHFDCLDPSEVVIDEIHGLWLALAIVPSYLLAERTVMVCLVAFVGFRLFDICKPWPIPILERAPGAWGVMLDDSLAGILAGLCTLVLVQ